MDSVKIYLAGLKSRVASFELSRVLDIKQNSLNKKKLITLLKTNSEQIKLNCNKYTNQWVKLFSNEQTNKNEEKLTQISNFVLDKTDIKSHLLNIRSFNDSIYLCNSDMTEKISITSSDNFPFESIANNPKVYFEKENSYWIMRIRCGRR